MRQKEYKRPGIRKPETPRSMSTYNKYHHTIDREIDDENIWYIEINGKKERRIPVTLSSWEEMKFKAKEDLHAVVLLKFVGKSGRHVERFKD